MSDGRESLIEARDLDALGAFLIHADTLCNHKDREVCLAADIVYGWGPGASDWDEAKTPALEALSKLFSADGWKAA